MHTLLHLLLLNGAATALCNLLGGHLALLCWSASQSSSATTEEETNNQVQSEYGTAIGAGALSPVVNTTATAGAGPGAAGAAAPGGSNNNNSTATAGGTQGTAAAGSIGQVINITSTSSDVYAIQASEAATADEQATAETAVNGIETASEDELTNAYEAGVSTSYNQLAQNGMATPGTSSNNLVLILAVAAGGLLLLSKRGRS